MEDDPNLSYSYLLLLPLPLPTLPLPSLLLLTLTLPLAPNWHRRSKAERRRRNIFQGDKHTDQHRTEEGAGSASGGGKIELEEVFSMCSTKQIMIAHVRLPFRLPASLTSILTNANLVTTPLNTPPQLLLNQRIDVRNEEQPFHPFRRRA